MAETASSKINLLNFNRNDLQRFFVEIGEKPFRALQILKWVHQLGVIDFDAMSNISKALRQRLQESTEFCLPEIAYENTSKDGTHKWLLRLADGNCIETVFIPEKNRGTLCVSSQVGCALDCSFCSTGKQGFSRNLTVAEIISQLWIATRRLAADGTSKLHAISNVVMMGMGEPLLNYEAVVKAMDLMMDDLAYNLSKYRVTLSTSGMIPAMLRLKTESKVALAVSLHAPNDPLRDQLVPLNKKYPLKILMAVCKDYFSAETKREIMFEYVMLEGVNDKIEHAKQLVRLLQGIPCKVNLIPFNPFPGSSYRRSSMETILIFQNIIKKAGIHATVRKTRGDDVDAACGQLVGEVQDRTRRTEAGRARKRKIIPIIAV